MSEKELSRIFKDEFGISVKEVIDPKKKQGFARLSNIGGILRDMPYLAKIISDGKFYGESYIVHFNNGIGKLQRSVRTPGRFRANVVEFGNNNKIVGQAELERLNPSGAMKLNNAVLAIYSVAAVITNQYFLARIDKNIEGLRKITYDIKRFLENDKKTKQVSEYEFIEQCLENISFIESEPLYAQSTLTTVQGIKINASANMKFFKEQIETLVAAVNDKNKMKDIDVFIGDYQGLFPQYWMATLVYELASYMECRLSGITDRAYLKNMGGDMFSKIMQYKEDYESFDLAIHAYIDGIRELKGCKQLETTLKLLDSVGGALLFGAAGVVIGKAGSAIVGMHNEKLEEVKNEIDKRFADIQKLYSDFNQLSSSIEAVLMIDAMANKPLEILVDKEDVYIKTTAISPMVFK